MKAPRIVVLGLILVCSLSLLIIFAQATPGQKQEPKKQEPKPPQKSAIPKEIEAIIQEGLATKQGRQDIPFSIFKSMTFPVPGGMHTVIFFKAKNADLGYATPVAAAPQGKQAQPAASPAGTLETRLAVVLQFFQADEAGAMKASREATIPVTLRTEGAGYDAAKEEWYALGVGLPYGKYTIAMLIAHIDPKKGVADQKKVGVSYYDVTLPGLETYQTALDTTSVFYAKDIKQMNSYEAKPIVHRGLFTYSVLQIVPNLENVITAEDKAQIEVFFIVLGAKPKPESAALPASQPQQQTYEVEVNYEVQKEDGAAVIRWQAQTYPSPLIDQNLPLKQTKVTTDQATGTKTTSQSDLALGKYVLVLKIKDKVSGFTVEKKLPLEVK
ncbi:MAG: hypothetical protein ABR951_03185 [Candidatus Aminicenantales bacterium]